MEWFPIILKINSKTLTIAYKTLAAKHNLECILTYFAFNWEGAGGSYDDQSTQLAKSWPQTTHTQIWPWLFSSLASWYSQSHSLYYTHSGPSSRSLNHAGLPPSWPPHILFSYLECSSTYPVPQTLKPLLILQVSAYQQGFTATKKYYIFP